MLEPALAHAFLDPLTAGADDLEAFDQRRRRAVLRHDAVDSELHRLGDGVVGDGRGDEDDGPAIAAGPKRAEKLHAVGIGHVDVEHQYVGLGGLDRFEDGGTGRGLRDHLEAAVTKHRLHPGQYEGMIVGDEDPPQRLS